MTTPRLPREWILPFSMFFGSFAWSFVFVSLPFYIEKMSTVDATATLRWTGWILGVSSLVTVVTAPFSARLFGERHPRRSFVWTQLLQGSGFFLMAVARTLPELFFSRMLLGFMGAVSTFAFIMVGRSGGDVRPWERLPPRASASAAPSSRPDSCCGRARPWWRGECGTIR